MQPDGPTIHEYVNDVVDRKLGNYLHVHRDIGDIICKKINEIEGEHEDLPM